MWLGVHTGLSAPALQSNSRDCLAHKMVCRAPYTQSLLTPGPLPAGLQEALGQQTGAPAFRLTSNQRSMLSRLLQKHGNDVEVSMVALPSMRL